MADTVSRLLGLLDAKGLKLFAVIDQQAEARAVGLELRETTLVVFGNPGAGTGVMAAAPLAALTCPSKSSSGPNQARAPRSATPIRPPWAPVTR